MRKTSLYVAAWFAAGVGAVALATGAVSMVGSQVTGDRPAPLSADQVRSELAGAEASTTTTVPGTSTTAPGPAITEPDGGPVTTSPGAPGGPGPAPTVATTAPPGPGPSPTTTAAPPPAPPAETRTYTLIGGTATLRFSASGVEVVVASPNAGYSVDLQPTHDTGVRVEFESDEHRSRVEGWWDDGPQDEVEETD